ncbi:MAG: bactofilin family protein [Anaerolineae bacterium]
MKRVKRYLGLLIVLCSILLVAQPVLADGSEQIAVVGRDYVLESGQTLSHDLAVVGGGLTLQAGSQVLGSVAVTGGNVVVAGHIKGDLVVIGGSLNLGNTAIVDGDVVTLGSINRDAGAIVRGQILTGLGASADRRSFDRIASIGSMVRSGQWIQGIVSILGIFLLLCLCVMLATLLGAIWPEKIRIVGVTMRANWLQCLGTGLLTLLVGVILVPILVVICIGIPVAVVLLLALAISGLVGWAALGQYVGERMLQALNIRASSLVQTAAGVTLLTLLALIPCLGTLMTVIVGSVAIGAVLLSRFGTIGYPLATLPGTGSGALAAPPDPVSTPVVSPGNPLDPEA